jgi:hypothetical protein
MSKTVTLRLSDDDYQLFRQSAEKDKRTLSNYIVTATKYFIQENELLNEAEMEEIRDNVALGRSIHRGHAEAKAKQGRIVVCQ